ncbi:MAG TPA: response regulator [Pseudomonadales bacterium]|nr:response regulator [Pseudomonadales bacterium]
MTMAPEGRRILLVEDDRYQRKAAEATLRRHGYQVQVAVDGEEALAKAAEDPLPHLILLDLIMPKLSGFEVLRRLKADPRTAGVPVVILSNLGQSADVAQATAAGAAAYFIKAKLTLHQLADKIDELFLVAPV